MLRWTILSIFRTLARDAPQSFADFADEIRGLEAASGGQVVVDHGKLDLSGHPAWRRVRPFIR